MRNTFRKAALAAVAATAAATAAAAPTTIYDVTPSISPADNHVVGISAPFGFDVIPAFDINAGDTALLTIPVAADVPGTTLFARLFSAFNDGSTVSNLDLVGSASFTPAVFVPGWTSLPSSSAAILFNDSIAAGTDLLLYVTQGPDPKGNDYGVFTDDGGSNIVDGAVNFGQSVVGRLEIDPTSQTPEPGSLALTVGALAAAGVAARRRLGAARTAAASVQAAA